LDIATNLLIQVHKLPIALPDLSLKIRGRIRLDNHLPIAYTFSNQKTLELFFWNLFLGHILRRIRRWFEISLM